MIQTNSKDYKMTINGVSVADALIDGSQNWNVGFIDSGTTFSYIPYEMWDGLVWHFDNYCTNA